MLTVHEEIELHRLRELLAALAAGFWVATILALGSLLSVACGLGQPRPLVAVGLFELAVAAGAAALWRRAQRRRLELEELDR